MLVINKKIVVKENFGQRVEVTILNEYREVKKQYTAITGLIPDVGEELNNMLQAMTRSMRTVIANALLHDSQVNAWLYNGYLTHEGMFDPRVKSTTSGQKLVNYSEFLKVNNVNH